MTHHVLRDRGLANLDAELQQLPVYPRRTPGRVGPGHRADQLPDLGRDLGPSWPATLPSPIEPESLAMPTDHGVGLDQEERFVPGVPYPQ